MASLDSEGLSECGNDTCIAMFSRMKVDSDGGKSRTNSVGAWGSSVRLNLGLLLTSGLNGEVTSLCLFPKRHLLFKRREFRYFQQDGLGYFFRRLKILLNSIWKI